MYCFPLSFLLSPTGRRAALRSLSPLDQMRNSTCSPISEGCPRHGLQLASSLSPCNRPPLPHLHELHSDVSTDLVWKSFRKWFGEFQTDLFRFSFFLPLVFLVGWWVFFVLVGLVCLFVLFGFYWGGVGGCLFSVCLGFFLIRSYLSNSAYACK